MKHIKTLTPLPRCLAFDFRINENAEVEVTPSSFVRDGVLHVSGEDGMGLLGYDDSYIHPTLEAWAASNDGYWEWVNPACVCFIRN